MPGVHVYVRARCSCLCTVSRSMNVPTSMSLSMCLSVSMSMSVRFKAVWSWGIQQYTSKISQGIKSSEFQKNGSPQVSFAGSSPCFSAQDGFKNQPKKKICLEQSGSKKTLNIWFKSSQEEKKCPVVLRHLISCFSTAGFAPFIISFLSSGWFSKTRKDLETSDYGSKYPTVCFT
jgi:hypothetical protein